MGLEDPRSNGHVIAQVVARAASRPAGGPAAAVGVVAVGQACPAVAGDVPGIGHPVADGQGTSLSRVPRQNQPILRASATSAGSALVSKRVASGVVRDFGFRDGNRDAFGASAADFRLFFDESRKPTYWGRILWQRRRELRWPFRNERLQPLRRKTKYRTSADRPTPRHAPVARRNTRS